MTEPKMKFSHLPTVFTDGVNIACRNDGGVLLQFVSETPDFLVENFRTVMDKESCIEFMDSLASAIEYYPVNKEDEQEEDKEES